MIRIFLNTPLNKNDLLTLEDNHFHYLKNVMRKSVDDEILVFNGQDGEWLSKISAVNKKNLEIEILEKTKDQEEKSNIHLYFSLIKKDKVDIVVEKSTELNISSITPIVTSRTITSKTNIERLKLTSIEASEQSERLTIPDINEVMKFDSLLSLIKKTPDTTYFMMDERGEGKTPLEAFSVCENKNIAFIIGPEGGFSKEEFEVVNNIENIAKISLGKHILRAETAVITAISSWHSIKGDFIKKQLLI